MDKTYIEDIKTNRGNVVGKITEELLKDKPRGSEIIYYLGTIKIMELLNMVIEEEGAKIKESEKIIQEMSSLIKSIEDFYEKR